MRNIEHWFCPGCGEIDGPRAGMTCHGPGNTGGCASVGNKVVEISHDAAKRLTGAVDLLRDVATAGVEHEDPRMGYLTVQIDRDTWDALATYRGGSDVSA